jgi:Protein of unknown function (DUF2924)
MEKQTVDALIDELPEMARPRMAELWEEHFGHPPATKLRVDLMRPILAYRIQERQRGALPSDMQRRLQDAMKAYSPQARASPVGRYKAGIRIIRQWGGVIHEVQVTDEGYVYQGEIYKSLSPIANRITGTRWSGPMFFGTKSKEVQK